MSLCHIKRLIFEDILEKNSIKSSLFLSSCLKLERREMERNKDREEGK